MPDARWSPQKLLPFAALLLAAGAYYWFFVHRVQLMRQHSKYTVGYVTGWTQTLKSGRSIDYRCSIAHVAYAGSVHEEPGMDATVGARYAVAFDSLDPATHWAYYDTPVPDSAALPPPTGWSPHAFAERRAQWQQADSMQRAYQGRQQDSLQLVRWQHAHAKS